MLCFIKHLSRQAHPKVVGDGEVATTGRATLGRGGATTTGDGEAVTTGGATLGRVGGRTLGDGEAATTGGATLGCVGVATDTDGEAATTVGAAATVGVMLGREGTLVFRGAILRLGIGGAP